MAATKTKAPAKAPKKCGAKLGKRPGNCTQAAGWGTSHPGRGRCKLHGGATRNHTTAATKQEAKEFAEANLAHAGTLDPLDGLILSVHLAEGVVNFYRQKVLSGHAEATEDYLAAIDRYNRFAKAAVDAKVADRLAAIGERAGEQIALICEEALAALVRAGAAITTEQRTAYANAVGDSTQRLEGEAPQLLLPGAPNG